MSTGFTTINAQYTLRTDIWSSQLQTLLLDDLIAMRWVKHLTEFPDGVTFHIPSLGEAEVHDFAEGQALQYNKFDEGDYTFAFDKYQYSGNSISEKYKRDSFYAQEVMAAFVPRQHRALMEAIEVRIFDRINAAHTVSSANQINGVDHRWVGSGTAPNGGLIMTYTDFSKARLALVKANVPLNSLIAVVDPTVAYSLENQSNVVNLMTPNPQYQGVVSDSMTTGMHFRFNIFGFDVYESNYLPRPTTQETINSKTTTTQVNNFFFSGAGGDIAPIIGGFRQMPTVQSKFNMDLQQTDFATITEHGWKAYRKENIISVLTDYNVVS